MNLLFSKIRSPEALTNHRFFCKSTLLVKIVSGTPFIRQHKAGGFQAMEIIKKLLSLGIVKSIPFLTQKKNHKPKKD